MNLIFFYSGTKLRDLVQNKSQLNKDEQLLRQIQDQSDNESELSFSELVSDYAASRQTNEKDVDSDGSFEKLEISEADGLANKTEEGAASFLRRSLSEVSSFESSGDFDDCRSNVSEERIVKWSSQLLLALEKLHYLGVVCR